MISCFRKSFSSAECFVGFHVSIIGSKTELKSALETMKLLMYKREKQLKELKGKVAHLLEAGKDQAARVLVEDVVKLEKTMKAYELLKIYCERIVEGLPFIELQKLCPIDLKGAVASVIFASPPRCPDLPDLTDVRENFSAKYGKDFTSSALELRPDCGVSRQLVENLSLRPPDGPTKIKILTAIAKEHNVKWDPECFEKNYSEAPSDLLNGPSSFHGTTYIPEQLPPTQQSVNYRSYFQAPARKVSPNSNSYGLDLRPAAQFEWPDDSFDSQVYEFDIEGGLKKEEFMNSAQYVSDVSPKQSWSMGGSLDPQAAALFSEHARRDARTFDELSFQGINGQQQAVVSKQSPTFGSGDQRRQGASGSSEANQHLKIGPDYNFSALNPVPNRSSFREESTKSSGREYLLVPGNSSSSPGEIPARENTNKASYVHPKLPDYDTLKASFLVLRQNYINGASRAHPSWTRAVLAILILVLIMAVAFPLIKMLC